MKKNKVNKKTKKELQADKERMMLLAKADQITGEKLFIGKEGLKTENEIKKFALGDIDNPTKKYDLYYKGIMKLLRQYLPKGKENKKARAYIYEEKNTLLTRGKRLSKTGIRGADSRMAYTIDIEEVLNIISSWIVNRGTMIELFNTLRDLNISKGHGLPNTK